MQNAVCDRLSVEPFAVLERPDDVHMDRFGNACSHWQRNSNAPPGPLRQRLIPSAECARDALMLNQSRRWSCRESRVRQGNGEALAEVTSLLHERRFCRKSDREQGCIAGNVLSMSTRI